MAATLRRYPVVALTLLAGVAVAILRLTGADSAARWVASIHALGVAAHQSVGMVRDIMRGHWGIDILAVTAIVATVSVGEYIASLFVVLILTGGAALEDYAAGRATRELTSLLERAPRTAHREQEGGGTTGVPIEAIEVGDMLLVRPSEVVPVDGLMLSGPAVFDESALTGESLPVEYGVGGAVPSGVLNGPAAVRFQATAREEDSQYSRIIALVREAAGSRAPVVRLTDRYAVPFTVFALLLAAAAWFLSGDASRFAEVLVVATPCPVLIAAPVAFLGGISQSAKAGIIVEGAGTLEQLSRVRTAAFDKTGMLTRGQPTLDQIRSISLAPMEMLALAAPAEQYSSHVLAAAVVAEARARQLSLETTDTAAQHATHGVTAIFKDLRVVVGKQSFVAEGAAGVQEAALVAGQMAVYVGVDGHFAGTLIMRDPVRPEAPATLAALRSMGVSEMVILTGDAAATAQFIADEVGITQVRAGLLPEDKVRLVNELPQRQVMMVGDGVNDTPVLAASDVGVAMGAKGSTAASESPDVVIMAAVGYPPAVAGALSQEVVDLAAILYALRALSAGKKPR